MSILSLVQPRRSKPSPVFREMTNVVLNIGGKYPDAMRLLVRQLAASGDLPEGEATALLAMIPAPVSRR